MFFDIPLSAYLICFGPLALTIFGFILFALRTDVDARRTYLRNMDLRTDEERGDEEPKRPTVTRRFEAETPANTRITFNPPNEDEGNIKKSDE